MKQYSSNTVADHAEENTPILLHFCTLCFTFYRFRDVFDQFSSYFSRLEHGPRDICIFSLRDLWGLKEKKCAPCPSITGSWTIYPIFPQRTLSIH
jgi:hypothetical protein